MLLYVLLACAPKAPPEGSTELNVPVSGASSPILTEPAPVADAPVPLGEGRGWTGPATTDPQRAFEAAEASLAELEALPPPTGAVDSAQRAARAAELAEAALAQLEIAANEPGLRVPATCRAGDAWRLSAAAMRQMQPLPHDDPARQDAVRAERDASAVAMEEEALRAYGRVIADRSADARWLAHARWGLDTLEPR